MNRLIADLLGRPEHEVSKTIGLLEDKNGYPSHDIRHMADGIHKTRTKLIDLELDPDDTTGEELYHALLIKFQTDSQEFDTQQGAAGDNFNAKANKAIKIVRASLGLPERWRLKTSAIKQLLITNPPKYTMKQLNYRSAASLVKRENARELYLAANLLESKSCQKTLQKQVSKLDSSNFELSTISLTSLAKGKWRDYLSTDTVLYNADAGCLAIVENRISTKAPLLSLVVELIDSLSELSGCNLSAEVAKLSPILAWWSDVDGLIANLKSEAVSFNIKDVSTNHNHAKQYDERVIDCSRNSFWRELLDRYDNPLAIEEDKLTELKDQLARFKAPVNQPVFEYAEDI